MRPTQAAVGVLLPSAHARGVHKTTFVPSCRMCHTDDRTRSDADEHMRLEAQTEIHRVLRWMEGQRQRLPMQHALRFLRELRSASSNTGHPYASAEVELLMLRTYWHVAVKQQGLSKMGITLRPGECTYIVVAQMAGAKPVTYCSASRDIIIAFALSIDDGMLVERFKSLEQLFSMSECEHEKCDEQTRSAVVMFYNAPLFQSWTSAAYTIHTAYIYTDNVETDAPTSGHTATGASVVDGGPLHICLESTDPRWLKTTGLSVTCIADDPHFVVECTSFQQEHTSLYIDSSETNAQSVVTTCQPCIRLRELVIELRKQRNEYSDALDSLTLASPCSPPNGKVVQQLNEQVDDRFVALQKDHIVLQRQHTDCLNTLTSERARADSLQATTDASATQFARVNAELQLLRDDKMEKDEERYTSIKTEHMAVLRQLTASKDALMEMRRQVGVFKGERKTHQNARIEASGAIKRLTDDLRRSERLVQEARDETAGVSSDLHNVRRCNAALEQLELDYIATTERTDAKIATLELELTKSTSMLKSINVVAVNFTVDLRAHDELCAVRGQLECTQQELDVTKRKLEEERSVEVVEDVVDAATSTYVDKLERADVSTSIVANDHADEDESNASPDAWRIATVAAARQTVVDGLDTLIMVLDHSHCEAFKHSETANEQQIQQIQQMQPTHPLPYEQCHYQPNSIFGAYGDEQGRGCHPQFSMVQPPHPQVYSIPPQIMVAQGYTEPNHGGFPYNGQHTYPVGHTHPFPSSADPNVVSSMHRSSSTYASPPARSNEKRRNHDGAHRAAQAQSTHRGALSRGSENTHPAEPPQPLSSVRVVANGLPNQ